MSVGGIETGEDERAMFRASKSCPWLAAPSPYIAMATLGLFWYFWAKASPAYLKNKMDGDVSG